MFPWKDPKSLLGTVDSFSLRGQNLIDDRCDKLISHLAVVVVIIFAVITGVYEYSGSNISCLPYSKDGVLTRDMQSHINEFCLTQTLYYYDFWRYSQLPPLDPLTPATTEAPEVRGSRRGRSTTDPGAGPGLEMPGLMLEITASSASSSAGRGPTIVTSGGETVHATEVNHLITLVFVLQAIFLKLPYILWNDMLEGSGASLKKLVSRLLDVQFEDSVKRESSISQIAGTLTKLLQQEQRIHWGERGKYSAYFQSFTSAMRRGQLFSLYMLSKVLYLLVLAVQFWLLSMIFGFNFWVFGPSVISQTIRKEHSFVCDFPSAVLCKFRSPTLIMPAEGVWVQCVLVFNMFLRNILLFEWFGFTVLFILTLLSIAIWLGRWCYDMKNTSFVADLLCAGIVVQGLQPTVVTETDVPSQNKEESEQLSPVSGSEWDWQEELSNEDKVERFVRDFLTADGVFLFRIIKINTNEFLSAELVRELFKLFSQHDSNYIRIKSE